MLAQFRYVPICEGRFEGGGGREERDEMGSGGRKRRKIIFRSYSYGMVFAKSYHICFVVVKPYIASNK